MKSAIIDNLHKQANIQEMQRLIKILLSNLLAAPTTEQIAFFSKNYRNIEKYRLVESLRKIIAFDVNDKNSQHLKRFFSARAIIEIYPENVFTLKNTEPEWLYSCFRNTASDFYEYGKSQFESLMFGMNAIVNDIIEKDYQYIAVIEMPLGNIIPVRIITSLLRRGGIKHDVINISAPRNDCIKHGNTYKSMIKSIESTIAADVDLILFVDEVITGSRFNKTNKEFEILSKKLKIDLFSVGLVAPIVNPLTIHQMSIRNGLCSKLATQVLSRIDTSLSRIMFPVLPKFNIDSGAPVVYESPLIWGEEDFVNGVRKINFIFNMIEQVKLILKELTRNSDMLRRLKYLWSNDTDGNYYKILDSVMISTHKKIYEAIDWTNLLKQAEIKYIDDYVGKITELTCEEAGERLEWIYAAINSHLMNNNMSEYGGLAMNSIQSLISAMSPEEFCSPDRDYSYCQYTLPFNDCIRTFHETLIDNILKSESVKRTSHHPENHRPTRARNNTVNDALERKEQHAEEHNW